jgi:hypothetical protein
MSPAEHNIVESASGFVHASLGRVNGVCIVGVLRERPGVDNGVREGATNNEGIL